MDLAELIGLRPVPCGGLLVALTRRCPLSCAHCSTDSSPTAAERPDAGQLLRFVGSFGDRDRPEVVMLTGGEPLLLPELAARLAALARAAGSRVALLSGMFFARDGRVPDRIMRTITALDHFSASLDVHHEREVPRAGVFSALRAVLDAGIPVSVHLTGTGPDDPYLADAVADVRRVFAGRVPLLVNEIRPLGRARGLAPATPPGPDGTLAAPCALAAWPVVAFDGTVAACCNQWTVDRRPVPAHLRLGHIAADDWPAVRARALGSPVLRLLRAVGPQRLHARYTSAPAPSGYCRSCHALADRPDVLTGAARDASGRVGAALDHITTQTQLAAGPAALLRRMGCGRYAHLVERQEEAGPAGERAGGFTGGPAAGPSAGEFSGGPAAGPSDGGLSGEPFGGRSGAPPAGHPAGGLSGEPPAPPTVLSAEVLSGEPPAPRTAQSAEGFSGAPAAGQPAVGGGGPRGGRARGRSRPGSPTAEPPAQGRAGQPAAGRPAVPDAGFRTAPVTRRPVTATPAAEPAVPPGARPTAPPPAQRPVEDRSRG
ncbi:radical SAM protein [Streptomyces sp. enrichment culture]|uniref:radical SAM protein n=1 Tax=Streptomyces sp. enrichment culture TaxID=1795815 RepID=UPI003F57FA20